MDELFILKPELSELELQDGIDERITKILAVFKCLLAGRESEIKLDETTLYDVIWLLRDMLEEINDLRKIKIFN